MPPPPDHQARDAKSEKKKTPDANNDVQLNEAQGDTRFQCTTRYEGAGDPLAADGEEPAGRHGRRGGAGVGLVTGWRRRAREGLRTGGQAVRS